MAQSQKNTTSQIKALDKSLIDGLYKDLSSELDKLLDELKDSTKMGAYGACATISSKIAEIAQDLKKLQRLPTMLTNPFVKEDPREILEEIYKKYKKAKKKSSKVEKD